MFRCSVCVKQNKSGQAVQLPGSDSIPGRTDETDLRHRKEQRAVPLCPCFLSAVLSPSAGMKAAQQNTGKGLLTAIDSEFSGDTKDLLNTIVRANVYPQGFYAKNIYDSIRGAGTNDSKLIRNICARAGVDLPLIRQAYQNDYNSDMLTDIQGDTSGHYRQILSALVANAK